MKRSLLLEAVFTLYRNCVEIGYTLSLAWGLCFQNKLRITMPHTVHALKGAIKVAFFNGCVYFFQSKLARERRKGTCCLKNLLDCTPPDSNEKQTNNMKGHFFYYYFLVYLLACNKKVMPFILYPIHIGRHVKWESKNWIFQRYQVVTTLHFQCAKSRFTNIGLSGFSEENNFQPRLTKQPEQPVMTGRTKQPFL